MDQRITSSFGFIGSVVAAALAAAVMSGNARAEGPIENIPPITGTLTRAEVHAEVMKHRAEISSAYGEFALQQEMRPHGQSGYTRAQARADYLASREEVRAMTAEDSGSQRLSRAPVRSSPSTTAVAASELR